MKTSTTATRMCRSAAPLGMMLGACMCAMSLALAAGCGGKSYVKKGAVVDTIEQAQAKGEILEAIGIGAADPAIESPTQRRSLSRDAAIVKAQFEMLSMVKGVEIEGGIKVSRAIEIDSTLESKIKEMIRGAEIVKTEYLKDDGAVVTLHLPKKRLEQLEGIKFK